MTDPKKPFDRVCAWCNKVIEHTADPGVTAKHPVTHGICEDCAKKMLSEMDPSSLAKALDNFDFPVVAVDGDTRIIATGEKALDLLNRKIEEVNGFLCGNVLECVNSKLPGGCGKTEHCAACSVRNLIGETFRTGKPAVSVPAYIDIETVSGTQRRELIVSTEKVSNYVLLNIRFSK